MPQRTLASVDPRNFSLDLSTDTSRVPSKGGKKRRSTRKKILKRTLLFSSFVVLCGVLAVGYHLYTDVNKTFKGNALKAIASIVQPDIPLKTDTYGNTNILLLGTSESDPGHPGAQLTDSMMIASLNQKTHQMFLVSIPRDLWVTYDKPCAAGYAGKINAVYECSLGTGLQGLSQVQNDEATAESLTAAKVSETMGASIQYVVHMNLAVIQKVVDAVGGIDITIDSPDPRGILDRNFDWRCNYRCYLVKYPNGPAHLTGADAMWLAQARNDSGGYGLPRGNFDREANQRKILMATKDKATSIGFLANPLNVVNFLDALGTNIHTTIDASEIKSFVDAMKSLPTNNITSIDIQDDSTVLTTGVGPDGSDIVRPVLGLQNYTDLQAFMTKLLQGQAPMIAEKAAVEVANASGVAGAAGQEAAKLQSDGFLTSSIVSVPASAGGSGAYTLYDLSQGKDPATLAALQKALGVTAAAKTLPAGVSSTAAFVVVVGGQKTANSSTP